MNIGIVGLGRLGSLHAEHLYMLPRVHLQAVCSIVDSEREMARETFGVSRCYADFDKFIVDPTLDAVVIASTTAVHVPQIIAALEHNLHVFCEKPLGLTVEGCDQVAEVAKRHPYRIVMLGFMRRFDPSYVEAWQEIQDGNIGDPFFVRAYGLDPLHNIDKIIPFLDGSGGIALDLMIHDIDLARWLFSSEVASVTARGGCFSGKEFSAHNDVDNAVALLEMNSGALATLFGGRCAPHGYHIETEIAGTKGMLRIGGIPRRNGLEYYVDQGVLTKCQDYFRERFRDAYRIEMEAFIECVEQGRNPPVGIEDGKRATEIAIAIRDSLQNRNTIHLEVE